jgi:hypothetical protein
MSFPKVFAEHSRINKIQLMPAFCGHQSGKAPEDGVSTAVQSDDSVKKRIATQQLAPACGLFPNTVAPTPGEPGCRSSVIPRQVEHYCIFKR